MRRPDVLARTYDSFTANLRDVDWTECRLWINVDPGGPGDAWDVVAAARKYFGDVVANVPSQCNFAAAVKWCWSRPFTTPFALSLEDDWLLTQPVSVLDLVALMRDPGLSCVNLNCYPFIKDHRINLSPGLMRSSHANKLSERLNLTDNPEQQLRTHHRGRTLPNHEPYRGVQFGSKVIRDIGRAALANSGWRKSTSITFNEWQMA